MEIKQKFQFEAKSELIDPNKTYTANQKKHPRCNIRNTYVLIDFLTAHRSSLTDYFL